MEENGSGGEEMEDMRWRKDVSDTMLRNEKSERPVTLGLTPNSIYFNNKLIQYRE